MVSGSVMLTPPGWTSAEKVVRLGADVPVLVPDFFLPVSVAVFVLSAVPVSVPVSTLAVFKLVCLALFFRVLEASSSPVLS